MFFGGMPGGMPGMQGQTDEPEKKEQVNTTEFYEILQVPKDATTQQIKKAYRKKALKEHPDRGGDPTRFSRLKDACDTLTDPEKRQLYDEYGEQGVKNGGPPGMGGNIFDFFNPKQKDNRPKKMKPKLVKVEVTLQQVYAGTMKEVTVTRYRVCNDCDGKGGSNCFKCEACKGSGVRMKVMQVGPGMMTQVQTRCDQCEGKGETMKQEDKCKGCGGKRVKQQEKVLQVAIDAGVPDSHDYIFYGQADELPDIMAGDVYARVTILKHDTFERRGADLVVIREISLLQALTRVTTTIKHLDGKEYLIATAPGQILENKELKTIRNLGMPFYKDSMSHGNLYFEFLVVFPKQGQIGKDHLEAIGKAFSYNNTNSGLENKADASAMDDYSDDLLNPKCRKNQEEQDEEEEGQGVQCQGQ